jgi:hypothetical protein
MIGRLDHLNVNLTPEEAARQLREMGVLERSIEFLAGSSGSHELRALASIVLSGKAGNLQEAVIREKLKYQL